MPLKHFLYTPRVDTRKVVCVRLGCYNTTKAEYLHRIWRSRSGNAFSSAYGTAYIHSMADRKVVSRQLCLYDKKGQPFDLMPVDTLSSGHNRPHHPAPWAPSSGTMNFALTFLLACSSLAVSVPQHGARPFRPERRPSNMDWNVPRHHGGFLSKRLDLHDEEYFNSPAKWSLATSQVRHVPLTETSKRAT
jgi:hypothetical protein